MITEEEEKSMDRGELSYESIQEDQMNTMEPLAEEAQTSIQAEEPEQKDPEEPVTTIGEEDATSVHEMPYQAEKVCDTILTIHHGSEQKKEMQLCRS